MLSLFKWDIHYGVCGTGSLTLVGKCMHVLVPNPECKPVLFLALFPWQSFLLDNEEVDFPFCLFLALMSRNEED